MYTQAATHSASSSTSDSGSGAAAGGLLIGKVVSLTSHGNPLIAYDAPTRQSPVEALTTVALDQESIGKEVVISFAQNNGGMAIVMGVIRRALDDVLAQQTAPIPEAVSTQQEEASIAQEKSLSASTMTEKPEVIVDGNKLEITAAEEITLRCGKASITLNKNGKILIKGEHMLNRTAGSYKIKSGSIQLN